MAIYPYRKEGVYNNNAEGCFALAVPNSGVTALNLNQEINEYFNNFQREKLNVWLHSVSYRIKNWPECDYEYIDIRMEIDYENKTIGKYEACYNMNGEYEDDYFVIY